MNIYIFENGYILNEFQTLTYINQDDILPLQHLIFKEVNSMYKLQYNHFNQCMEDMIPRMLKENKNIFYESVLGNKIFKYRFLFDEISIKPPEIPGKKEYMFPEDARKNNYTYIGHMT